MCLRCRRRRCGAIEFRLQAPAAVAVPVIQPGPHHCVRVRRVTVWSTKTRNVNVHLLSEINGWRWRQQQQRQQRLRRRPYLHLFCANTLIICEAFARVCVSVWKCKSVFGVPSGRTVTLSTVIIILSLERIGGEPKYPFMLAMLRSIKQKYQIYHHDGCQIAKLHRNTCKHIQHTNKRTFAR